MIKFAKECSAELSISLIDGPYDIWVLPNFETAADIQMTKKIGAVVTGASTIPE